MFSRILEKLTISGDTSCYELKTNSGITITTIGQNGLKLAIETLAKLGFYNTPVDESPPKVIEAESIPTIPAMPLRPALPSPMAQPIVNEGLGLVQSMKIALKNSLAENLSMMETKISELMDKLEDCPTFLEAKKEYLGSLDVNSKHHSSMGVYQFFFSSFENLVGDKKINDIKSSDVNRYLDALAHLPPKASEKPEYKGKVFKEIIEIAKNINAKAIKKSTQKKHVNYIRAFFNWCYDKLDLKRNPCAGISISRYKKSKEQARQAFDSTDLMKIFDPRITGSYKVPHKFWVPLIALYSGMRVNEVAQLFTDDIKSVEIGLDEAGQPIMTPCFDVSPVDGKSVKTESSERLIPVHPKLIELGLLDYHKDIQSRGLKRLFPGIKPHINGPGARVSVWFNNSILRTKCGIEDHRKTFHGFRNTFWTLGDRSKVLETSMVKLAGYSPGDNIQRIHYIKRADVAECKEALEQIRFPALDLVPYKAHQFKDYLDQAQTKAGEDDSVKGVIKKRRGRPPKAV